MRCLPVFFSYLIIFITLIPGSVYSQASEAKAWNELLGEARGLFRERQRDSALVIGQLALVAAIAQNGEADTSAAMVLHRLGGFYQVMRSPKCEEYYLRALEVWDKAPGTRGMERAKTLSNLGNHCIASARWAEAEALLNEALEAKIADIGNYAVTVASTRKKLAALFIHRERYDEAEVQLFKVLDIYDSLKTVKYQKVAEAISDLGNLYTNSARSAKGVVQ